MSSEKRICIFVDGENLRHSIVDLFSEFSSCDYLPKDAKWEKFFEEVAKKVVGPGEIADLIRTYWYVVQNIDFAPFNLNALLKQLDYTILKNVLSKDDDIKKIIDGIKDNKKLDEFLHRKANDLINTQETMSKRFAGWIRLQDNITIFNKSIEFRRAGAIRYDLFRRRLGKEKAVDIKLATDLVRLQEIYDIAVIVSGDQDYVPAVEAIKDLGKNTVNVSFKTAQGKLLPGGARRLNQCTDWSIEVEHSNFKKFLSL